MGELILGPNGKPLVFDPRDILKGGNMVLWDDARGGTHPWDANYFVSTCFRKLYRNSLFRPVV